MVLKIFTKEESPETDTALDFAKTIEEDEFEVEYLDLDNPETHMQAEIYQIFTSPSFVVAGEDGREISSWRGQVPAADEVKNYLRQ